MLDRRTTSSPKSLKARVLLAILALGAGSFLVLFITSPLPKDQKNNTHNQIAEDLKQRLAEEANKDSDNDGLKDWEEALYATNLQSPDTDGDGASDGEEIKVGRDPLKKGPNDTLVIPLKSPDTLSFDSNNSTHVFTQSIVSDKTFQSILNQQGGGKISASTIEEYLKSTPAQQALLVSDTPDPGLLNVSNDTSADAVKNYFEFFADIFIKNGDVFTLGDDLTIAYSALSTNNEVELRKLDRMITAFENIIQEANKLSISKNILWFHQQEIDLLIKTKKEIAILRNMNEDPIGALAALQSRVETKNAVTKLWQEDLRQWIDQNGISLGAHGGLLFLGKE